MNNDSQGRFSEIGWTGKQDKKNVSHPKNPVQSNKCNLLLLSILIE